MPTSLLLRLLRPPHLPHLSPELSRKFHILLIKVAFSWILFVALLRAR
jgi:hypothetical protein